jgi:hypothetical protein
MPSLVSVAENGEWDECHAMLDRGEGDVNERGRVRSAHTTRTACRHSTASIPLPAVRAGSAHLLPTLALASALRLPSLKHRLASHESPHPTLTSATCDHSSRRQEALLSSPPRPAQPPPLSC